MIHADHDFFVQTTARHASSSHWNDTQPDTVFQLTIKHLAGTEEAHSHSTSRKEAQHTALGPSKPLREHSVFQEQHGKWLEGQQGESKTVKVKSLH